jgi:hypothetical protein
VFPARYELNSYIVFRKRLVSKRLRLQSSFLGCGDSPIGNSATTWPLVPAPNDDDDECGAIC